MALVIVVYGIFYAPIISFLEAIAMETLGREKKSYGRIRLWGSIGFITVVLAFGKLIELLSVRVIIPSILIGSLLLTLISLTLPVTGDRKNLCWHMELRLCCIAARGVPRLRFPDAGQSRGVLRFFFDPPRNPGIFQHVHRRQLALASAAEILAMVYSEAIFSRLALERVLLISFAAAVLRWLVLDLRPRGRHPAVPASARMTYGPSTWRASFTWIGSRRRMPRIWARR